MSFDLERDDQSGIWTDYPKSSGERYKIRPLPPRLVQHFLDMTTKRLRDRTGAWEEHTDNTRYLELLYDHLFEQWEGITIGGKRAECNLENKMKLANLSGDRARWASDVGMLYANDDDARRHAEEKSFRGIHQTAVGLSRSDV